MSKEDWKNNSIDKLFKEQGLWKLGEEITILDLACGLSFRTKYIPASLRVGVDIYSDYFEHIESDVPYAVIKYDIRKIEDIIMPKSFDVVMALDVVEHLEKHEAIKLIQSMENIARKAVIIETPEGFIPQNIDIHGYGGDTYQTHRSGWEVQEFTDVGFDCFTRDYVMSDVQRHTHLSVEPNIKIIDAIKYV